MENATRNKRSKLSAFLLLAVIGCVVLPLITTAQTPAVKTPKQKNFGSSLKERAVDAGKQASAAPDDKLFTDAKAIM